MATPITALPSARPADRRGVFAWMLFDWANQPFQTLIVTFIFAPWFVAEVIGDPVRGQALWGAAAAIGGAIVAILAPLLGAMADRTGARKRWVLAFSVPYVLGCAGFWLARPAMPDPAIVLVVYVVAFIGSEFGTVFTNAMLPGLGPRREIGRISGSGWALGYLGGLVSLVLVLLLLAPAPGGSRTLLGIEPHLRPRHRRRRARPRHRPALGDLVPRLRAAALSLDPRRSRRAAPPASSAPASPISSPPSGSRRATGASSPS